MFNEREAVHNYEREIHETEWAGDLDRRMKCASIEESTKIKLVLPLTSNAGRENGKKKKSI